MERKVFVVLLLFILSGIYSCSPLKGLRDGETLLNKNIIKIDKPELKDGIRSILKQKPNRKILGVFRFHLSVYALANKENDSSKFRNWIKNTIGEKPVILDPGLTSKSTIQIHQFMINSGYFNAKVTDTTIYKRRKKANVYYQITAGDPYLIKSYIIQTADTFIYQLIISDSANSLIRNGTIFDSNILQKERNRVTNYLKNEGYYFFNQAYIRYDADTSAGLNRTNLKMIIGRVNENSNDSTILGSGTNHLRYHLNKVYIQTDYNPISNLTKLPSDTVMYKGYYFLSTNKKKKFKPDIIWDHMLMRIGDLYQIRNLENTYKLLGGLNVFKFINIKFEVVKSDTMLFEPLLNCFIYLTPSPKQEHREELEGTHNGGVLGIAGDIAYRNKNFLKGAELLEIKLKGGLESIKNFTDTSSGTSKIPFFNIYEIGPEINLSFPKILIPRKLLPKKLQHESPYSNSYTTLTANYDLQQRPEFKRTIANFSVQWSFNETATKSHFILPVEINFVNVRLNSAFKAKLDELNDPYLNYTYGDHLITNGRWTFVINTQKLKTGKNFYYYRLNVEFAGNSLWLANHIFSSKESDDEGFLVFKTRYAQYFKPDMDFRYYQLINVNNTLVYRIAGGIGIPYLNSFALPFEKAFFAGGSNDLRAFRARSIGPGSYDNVQFFEQSGEIKLNANVELRFDIFKILQGAAFIDAGNIWLLKADDNIPGGQFKSNRFLSEVAIGGGLGARLNFTFFIIRLDAGIPFKNPSFPVGQRWVINKPSLRTTTFNLGIGYPF